ncbi:MAG: Mrp/NBP35 family ATP-binding protein [Candidatus Thorarchaeota archaeon]
MNYQDSKNMKDSKNQVNIPLDQENIQLAEKLMKIKHKIVIMSGKGGVGKSTISANLAISLASRNRKVGILDSDIHGPCIPSLLGVKNKRPEVSNNKIVPVSGPFNLKVVSIDFFLPDLSSPVIWRGPLKMRAIKQFLSDVEWETLDYLIVDLPPGTGDEPLSIMQLINDLDGIIMVTVPTDISQHVVRKAINMVKQFNIPIIGIIENMSGFFCPKCHEIYNILGAGGGESLAEEYKIPFLGKIPIDPLIAKSSDSGKSFLLENEDNICSKAFDLIINKIIEIVE